MAFLQTSPLTGKEIKVGGCLIFPKEPLSFWKIMDISHCKTGKHGAAKSIMLCKTIHGESKNRKVVYPGPEDMNFVNDFGYTHRVVYDTTENEMVVNLETDEAIHFSFFGHQQAEVRESLKKAQEENGLKDAEGRPLVVKYTEVDGNGKSLFFWEFKYYSPDELPGKGIVDYIA